MKNAPLKVKRNRLSDQIIERIITMIAAGELKAGDKLPPEPRLMEQFGVGRSSIREAIGGLELLGLLSVRPGHGTVVLDATEAGSSRSAGLSLITIGQEKIRELVEARSELEQAMAGLAAERATAENLAELRRQHAMLERAGTSGKKRIVADLGFHMAMARASGNSVLLRLFTELHHPIRRWMGEKAKHDWGFDRVLQEHEAIIRAVEDHNPVAARGAMRTHIEDAGRKLVAAMLGTLEAQGQD